MKKLSKVTVKQEFLPRKEYELVDVCKGEYKPLTQKETKLLNELFDREMFNAKGWCMISHNGITRPLFVHQYKKGKVAPKTKLDSIWRDGNVDPKYILTTKGFVLAGDNYNNLSDGTVVPYSTSQSFFSDDVTMSNYKSESIGTSTCSETDCASGVSTFDVDHL